MIKNTRPPGERDPLAFVASPLITPARLQGEDLQEVFRIRPEWTRLGELAGDDVNAEDNVFVVRVGDKHPLQIKLNPWSAAILFEITRFTGSVTTNTNGRADDPKSKWYAKLTRSDAKDNTPVTRIIVAAGAGEQVVPGEDREDMHPESLSKRGGRTTASKDAREKAMRHARTAADKHAPAEFDVDGYMANLSQLVAEHDRILGVVVEDY